MNKPSEFDLYQFGEVVALPVSVECLPDGADGAYIRIAGTDGQAVAALTLVGRESMQALVKQLQERLGVQQ